jgi:hypothetical protein
MPTTNEPPVSPLSLYQMAVGHYFSRALALAAKLGIADLLKDGARDSAALAAANGTNPAALARMMRLLASVGVFAETEDGTFALTALGNYLRRGVAGSMWASVQLFAGVGIQDSWKELEYCVRTGEPAFRRNNPDADAFAAIGQDPEQAAVFDEAMSAFAPQTAAAVAAAYDFSRFATVADLGGGNGSLLIGILQANPAVRGLVFDLPRVNADARRKIAAAGLESRCNVVAGSFFDSVPDGADAYILKHVIHDWDDERAVAILKNSRRAMRAGCKLLIVEGIYPSRIDQSEASRGAAANDVNMLVCTGGRQRSEAEFRALYQAAGFALSRIVPTQARVCVIEGTPA